MNATEKHEQLIAAGWRSRLDGKWISPDPDDARLVFTFAAAWSAYHESRHSKIDNAE